MKLNGIICRYIGSWMDQLSEEVQVQTDDDANDWKDDEIAETMALETIRTLVNIGVRLVCIDFDSTFVDIHTSGEWTQTPEVLETHVRSYFRHLCPLLAGKSQMSMAIVTFSSQCSLIESVLRLCFDPIVADKIIVRCNDDSWSIQNAQAEKFTGIQAHHLDLERHSKVPYVISAALQANESQQTDPANYFLLHNKITSTDTLLIDDCPDNIAMASQSGIPSIHFDLATFRTRMLSMDKNEPERRRQLKLAKALSRRLQQPAKVICSSPKTRKCSQRTPIAFFTPSPMTKLKVSSRLGRPKSKRVTKFRILPERVAIKQVEDDSSISVPSTLSWNAD
ncbi:ATP-binding Cassette (ABC) superfamily [Thraustotheca clavata]|uniref:ATP-binding Cassette (ABC) superfamily n=1 Tax=Thraustotheca clavata TaxID=74557 RepID=A0A1V9Z7E7_9STRA|nr:ATP-binding Cassette (ABC) superfamily [Thraustotheca clavata]